MTPKKHAHVPGSGYRPPTRKLPKVRPVTLTPDRIGARLRHKDEERQRAKAAVKRVPSPHVYRRTVRFAKSTVGGVEMPYIFTRPVNGYRVEKT